MAAPDYVPVSPQDRPRRATQMPPADRWRLGRPGDFVQTLARQPEGRRMGNPGPDGGYALRLASMFRDRVRLAPGESWDDVEAGSVGIAMRRAATFGRAPVVWDLEVAFGMWGYLTDDPPADLVEERGRMFQAAAHDYWGQRAIVDRVPESTLRLTPADVTARASSSDWRSLFDG
jgi:hypothetical protein